MKIEATSREQEYKLCAVTATAVCTATCSLFNNEVKMHDMSHFHPISVPWKQVCASCERAIESVSSLAPFTCNETESRESQKEKKLENDVTRQRVIYLSQLLTDCPRTCATGALLCLFFLSWRLAHAFHLLATSDCSHTSLLFFT